jgi:hypothetical protein
MKEALAFLYLIRFIGMDLGGSKDGTGFRVNYPSPLFWFKLKVRTHILFIGFYLNHQ